MKRKHIVLFFSVLILLIFSCVFIGTNYSFVLKRFFTEGHTSFASYETSCKMEKIITECTINNFFDLTRVYFSQLPYNFEYYISQATTLFLFLVPIISVVCGISINNWMSSIVYYQIYKVSDKKTFLMKKTILESFKFAVTVFLAYFIALTGIYFLSRNTEPSEYILKYFLLDIVGERFYTDYLYLYYFVDGIVRFFLIPFVYSILGAAIAFYTTSKKNIVIIPMIYYFGISVISQILYKVTPLAIYINPVGIMANQAVVGYNSILLLGFTFVTLFVCLYLIRKKVYEMEF